MSTRNVFTRAVLGFVLAAALLAPLPAMAQDRERPLGFTDQASVSVGRPRPSLEGGGLAGGMPHIYHIEARHWPKGCEEAKGLYERFGISPTPEAKKETPTTFTAASMEQLKNAVLRCGEKFIDYTGENLVTSAGETAISKAISDTATQPASANYIALTNTAITAAVGDTTLSGEIVSNGLQRAQGTFADTSAAIGAPPTAGSLAIVGTTGAATLDYWVFACTFQGCTAVGTQVQTTTANATLSNANYVTGSFTGKLGAAYYVLVRTQSGTPPSGALTGGAAQSNTGATSAYISCGALVAGTAPTCTFADQSNTTTAFTVPASDQTFVGKYTLTKTFTATGTQSAQAFGIFNASSVGTLYYEGTFTSASLVTNDTLAFTETVYH